MPPRSTFGRPLALDLRRKAQDWISPRGWELGIAPPQGKFQREFPIWQNPDCRSFPIPSIAGITTLTVQSDSSIPRERQGKGRSHAASVIAEEFSWGFSVCVPMPGPSQYSAKLLQVAPNMNFLHIELALFLMGKSLLQSLMLKESCSVGASQQNPERLKVG